MKALLFYANILVFNILIGQQNLQKNFLPIKSQGILPEIFTRDIKETIKADLNDLSAEDKDKKIKSGYFTSVNYEIEKKVKSGTTLLNDEITTYINQIVDVILKNQPDLRKKIKVYTSKSSVVNAYCYDKGYLFVNSALVAHTKSEAELASVLCHEISHYTKQHNILDYIHTQKMEKSVEGKTHKDLFLERCQYSKTQESEADLEGFKLFEQTNYDLNDAANVFEFLQYSHLPFELVEFKKSFFESDQFKIPAYYSLKDLAPIRNNSNEDDAEHTHPNTAKRKAAIIDVIKQKQNSGRVKFELGETKFNYIRDLARFELCRLYLVNRDYEAAIYSSYILSQQYPDNVFLAQTISKSLYAISLYRASYLRYNKDSYLDGPVHYLQVESYPQQFYYLVNKMPDNEWNLMSLNYVYRAKKKFGNDNILSSLSDSLLTMMRYTNCNLDGFMRRGIVNINPNKDTTTYYKKVFLDLFENDKAFCAKFPKTVGHETAIPYTPKSYNVNKFSKKLRTIDSISIVMSLEPFYVIYNEDDNQIDYMESDNRQRELIEYIKTCSAKNKFKLVVLDPGLVDSSEVDKINDFSIVNDWLSERTDGSDNEKNKVPVFSVDEISKVTGKYGTSHVLKTGFVILKQKRYNGYVFYAVIYDFKQNKEVYVQQEFFKGIPSKNETESKICSLFHELKTGVRMKEDPKTKK
ncbi:MAG: M48 family metallopeptidase [Bacteroidota bacterium]